MLITGIAFLVFAALIEFTDFTAVGAAFLTGAVFVVLALVLGERLPTRNP